MEGIGLHVLGHARHVLALLDNERLVDEVEDDLGLLLYDLSVGQFGRHAALLDEHVTELGVLALELREHNHVVVHLRDRLVEHGGRRLLLRARGRGRGEGQREGGEGEREGARLDVFRLHSSYSYQPGASDRPHAARRFSKRI
jgi:hypothetical protein